MIMAVAALLAQNPHPSDDDIDAGLTNICRCGTHPRILQAALKAAGVETASKTEVVAYV